MVKRIVFPVKLSRKSQDSAKSSKERTSHFCKCVSEPGYSRKAFSLTTKHKTDSEVPLRSECSSVQHLVAACNRKGRGKEHVCALSHCAVHQKVTPRSEPTLLRLKRRSSSVLDTAVNANVPARLDGKLPDSSSWDFFPVGGQRYCIRVRRYRHTHLSTHTEACTSII